MATYKYLEYGPLRSHFPANGLRCWDIKRNLATGEQSYFLRLCKRLRLYPTEPHHCIANLRN